MTLLLLVVRWARQHRDTAPTAFTLGLVSGLVTFLPLLVWVANPAGHVAWLVLGLLEAAFTGVFAGLVARWSDRPLLPLVAAVAWTGVEAWRGLFPLNGFDWGGLGYAHLGSPLLGFARVGGVRSLTLLTVLAAAGLALLGSQRARGGDRVRLVAGASAVAVGLAGPLLVQPAPPGTSGRTVDVLAVQGNDAEERALPGREIDRVIAAQLVELTERSVARQGRPDVTVWPESSIDRDPTTERGADLLPYLERGAEVAGGNLIVGVNLDGPRPGTFLNTALVVDGSGDIVDRYVKRRLVPFGEYVPWRWLIGDLGPLRQVPRDGLPGDGPQTLHVGDVNVAVAICFETLFPELVRSNVRAGNAGLVLASTNDASFGRSSEPAQHLAQSRMRAVETGRWVVHASLSGVSAFASPDGSVTQQTELYTAAAIRADLPVVSQSTVFLRVGDVTGLVTRFAVLVLLIASTASWVARRRARQEPDT